MRRCEIQHYFWHYLKYFDWWNESSPRHTNRLFGFASSFIFGSPLFWPANPSGSVNFQRQSRWLIDWAFSFIEICFTCWKTVNICTWDDKLQIHLSFAAARGVFQNRLAWNFQWLWVITIILVIRFQRQSPQWQSTLPYFPSNYIFVENIAFALDYIILSMDFDIFIYEPKLFVLPNKFLGKQSGIA